MYVETLLVEDGPDVSEQLVTPLTPVIVHIPVPVGATALEGPVTVAVNVIVDPNVAVDAPATTETVGVAAVTVVVDPDEGATLK